MNYYTTCLTTLFIFQVCLSLTNSREDDLIPKLEAFIVNNKRCLLVCRGRSRGPRLNSLQIRCKNVNKYRSLTTVSDKDPTVTTSRLLVGRRPIFEEKVLVCYCINVYTGKRSNTTKLTKLLFPNSQDIKSRNSLENSIIRPHFLPKRNRKRSFKFNGPAKFSWRYKPIENSSCEIQCFHDGKLLSVHEYRHLINNKIIVNIKNASLDDAGFYYCKLRSNSKPTIYSSLFQLSIATDNSWSRWFTWYPCSVKCGTGRILEARKCFDHRKSRCDGPNVRTTSCVIPCTGNYTTFVNNSANPTFPVYSIIHTVENGKLPAQEDKSETLVPVILIVISVVIFSTGVTIHVKIARYYKNKRRAQRRPLRPDKPKIFDTEWNICGRNVCTRDITTQKNLCSPHTESCETEDSYISHKFDINTGLFDPKSFEDETLTVLDLSETGKENVEVRLEVDPEIELQRQGSSKSKASAYSSISDYFCPKPNLPNTINPDLCSWGRFNDKGGKLSIKGTGVSLYIPKMALSRGTEQIIYIGLMSSQGLYPDVEDGQTILSPAVICGPDGMQFERPVYLTVPHNAVMDDSDSWTPQVLSCSDVPKDENDCDQWKVLEDPEDKEPPIGHIDKGSMQIMIHHFTGYVIVGKPAMIESWIVPFFNEPKVDLDCSVRIYSIPATDASLEELHLKEKKLKGTMGDSSKLLIIENNNKDVVVSVKKVREGWSADEEQQNISFRDIWKYHNLFPNVTFTFERKLRDQFSFSSSFNAKQDTSDASTVTVKVSTSIKRQPSESSGYSTLLESGCETDVPYKIPLAVRKEMCYLLDPPRDDFQDWRAFAEKLGQRKVITNWIQHRPKESPTNYTIEWWEHTKSEDIPLLKLVEMFEEMNRHDVVDELVKIDSLRT